MNKHKIYKVYTHTAPNGDVYVGVTYQDLKLRWRPLGYKETSLQPYIEQYGWKAIKHEVIYSCEDRDEAYQVEEEMRQYYTEKGCCINKQRSGLVQSKDKKAYKQQWYNEHKEEKAEYKRQYRQNHKKEQAAYQRKYRLKKKQSQSENLGIAS